MAVMSHIAPLPVAPYRFRVRLAVTGLALAWLFAAVFLMLARQQDRTQSAGGETTAVTRLR